MRTLLFYLFKLGCTGFGGGNAMAESMYNEIVVKRKEMTNDEWLEFRAISLCTPGATSINIATLLGYRKYGVIGGILASFVLVIPSITLAVIVEAVNFRLNSDVLYSVQIAVIALVTVNIFRMVRSLLTILKGGNNKC